jgi:hypothetical protein
MNDYGNRLALGALVVGIVTLAVVVWFESRRRWEDGKYHAFLRRIQASAADLALQQGCGGNGLDIPSGVITGKDEVQIYRALGEGLLQAKVYTESGSRFTHFMCDPLVLPD